MESLKSALLCFEKEVKVVLRTVLNWQLKSINWTYVCLPGLVKIYPVWLCPFKLFPARGMLRTPSGREELYVDIGTYGVPAVKNFHPVQTTRRVESFVRDVKGYSKMFYSF